MMMTSPRAALWGATILAAAALPTASWAADAATTDTIVDTFRNGAAAWESTLRGYAMALFGLLVAVEVGFSALKLAVKGADLSEWLAELVNRILFVGFFSWLLLNSSTFARAIVDSFRQAGNAAASASGGAGGVRPSDIVDAGLMMASSVMSQDVGMGFEAIGQKVALMMAALIILVCFALMAAFLVLALVESYIVISAGVLMMGFGGSRWTKDFAVKTMVYAVSVGAKLFVLQLIVGLGETLVKGWQAQLATHQKLDDVLAVVASGIVMLALTKTVPDIVQGIVSGASPGNGGALLAASAAVGAATAGVAAGLAGAGAAVGGAAKLAGAQAAAGQLGAGTSGMGRAAALVGGTGKNLLSSAGADVGARLGGRARGGNMGGRMAFEMGSQAREITRAAQKPAPVPMPMTPEPQVAPLDQEGIIRGAGEGSAGQSVGGEAAASAGVDPGSTNPSEPVRGATTGAATVSEAATGGSAAPAETVSGAATSGSAGSPQPAPSQATAASAAAPNGTTTGGPTPSESQGEAGRATPASSGLGSRLGGRGAAAPIKPSAPPAKD